MELRANNRTAGRDCSWLYVVTNCLPAEASAQAGGAEPQLQEPIKDPARFDWREVTKVSHYWLEVDAMTKPDLPAGRQVRVREDEAEYGTYRQGAEDAENT